LCYATLGTFIPRQAEDSMGGMEAQRTPSNPLKHAVELIQLHNESRRQRPAAIRLGGIQRGEREARVLPNQGSTQATRRTRCIAPSPPQSETGPSRASIEENLCSRGRPPDTRRGAQRGRDLSALGRERSAGPRLRPWRKKRTDVEPPSGALTGRKVPRTFCSEIPALSRGWVILRWRRDQLSITNPRSTTSLKKQPWIAPPPRSVRVGTSCRAGMMLIRARCWVRGMHVCFRIGSWLPFFLPNRLLSPSIRGPVTSVEQQRGREALL